MGISGRETSFPLLKVIIVFSVSRESPETLLYWSSLSCYPQETLLVDQKLLKNRFEKYNVADTDAERQSDDITTDKVVHRTGEVDSKVALIQRTPAASASASASTLTSTSVAAHSSPTQDLGPSHDAPSWFLSFQKDFSSFSSEVHTGLQNIKEKVTSLDQRITHIEEYQARSSRGSDPLDISSAPQIEDDGSDEETEDNEEGSTEEGNQEKEAETEEEGSQEEEEEEEGQKDGSEEEG
ncbi:uncharacterized protein LOC131167621 [Malania oleifera]|uniref:uncharacterized protein LOC131167621 n=1 Tax=Malania oleifera TaxID=397392 RepID=UPI0025AE01E7|nr:uncharacterized protein LOC131167621 [Malania oleifera]